MIITIITYLQLNFTGEGYSQAPDGYMSPSCTRDGVPSICKDSSQGSRSKELHVYTSI